MNAVHPLMQNIINSHFGMMTTEEYLEYHERGFTLSDQADFATEEYEDEEDESQCPECKHENVCPRMCKFLPKHDFRFEPKGE